MARPKKKRKDSALKLTPIQKALKRKADRFLRAERDFWKQRYEIEDQYRSNAEALDLEFAGTIPENLSTIVWALSDGVAFVRYQSETNDRRVDFRAANMTLEQWGNEGLIIPSSKGEISLAQSGFFKGLGNITFRNCTFNDVQIGYVTLRHAYYDNEQLPSAVQNAIIDFQLAFMGHHLSDDANKFDPSSIPPDKTIQKLESMAEEFEALLESAEREEELQVFLKENPLILHPTAEQIPKKKLGEDFVTDFVLVMPSDQGPSYTLVEIERASHGILIKDNSLSSHANHAIKQTKDWDVWLESNKAYLQTKLPGFETPNYMVIIGRGNELDETAKQYLRSYNRGWKNTELLTYDDVLVRFRSVVSVLKKAIDQ